MTLEVSGQASAASGPGEGTLDDPALGKHDEAMKLATRNDLTISISSRLRCVQPPRRASARDVWHLEDALDEGKEERRDACADLRAPLSFPRPPETSSRARELTF